MTILTQLAQILVRQREPEDIDYDVLAAVLSWLAMIATGYFVMTFQQIYSTPLINSIFSYTIQAGMVFVFLKIANKDVRFVQTITVLFGVTAILQVLSLVFLQAPALRGLVVFISVWTFYLSIMIFKAAFDASVGKAILLTIAFHLLSSMLLMLLLPDVFNDLLKYINQANTQAATT